MKRTTSKKSTIPISALVGFGALAACQPDFNVPVNQPALDQAYFNCRVQPILTKSCSMFACHGADGSNGTNKRFFRIYARNRLRVPSITEAQRNSALTDAERLANYAAARALVDLNDVSQSVLLLKPLDQLGGGSYHRGADIYGQGNVFVNRGEADFQILSNWVQGQKDDPLCIEPGSNL